MDIKLPALPRRRWLAIPHSWDLGCERRFRQQRTRWNTGDAVRVRTHGDRFAPVPRERAGERDEVRLPRPGQIRRPAAWCDFGQFQQHLGDSARRHGLDPQVEHVRPSRFLRQRQSAWFTSGIRYQISPSKALPAIWPAKHDEQTDYGVAN